MTACFNAVGPEGPKGLFSVALRVDGRTLQRGRPRRAEGTNPNSPKQMKLWLLQRGQPRRAEGTNKRKETWWRIFASTRSAPKGRRDVAHVAAFSSADGFNAVGPEGPKGRGATTEEEGACLASTRSAPKGRRDATNRARSITRSSFNAVGPEGPKGRQHHKLVQVPLVFSFNAVGPEGPKGPLWASPRASTC